MPSYLSHRTVADLVAITLCGVVVGIASAPAFALFHWSVAAVCGGREECRIIVAPLAAGISFITFIASLLCVIVGIWKCLPLSAREGVIDVSSADFAKFATYHGLLNLAQIFSLRFVRSTSLMNAFYRGMGARIGERTFINTIYMSDCDLVSIGNDCVVGGDVKINGHVTEGGTLVRGRVWIGNSVTVGEGVTILPGAVIQDGVKIGAHAVVLKGQVLQRDLTYVGIPAKPIGSEGHYSNPPLSDPQDEGLVLEPSSVNIQQVLLEAYKLKHAEMLDLVRFMAQVTVAALGLISTIFLYSIMNHKPELLLAMTPLAGITYSILLGSAIGMQRVGLKSAEIEIMFRRVRVRGFDWELRFGSLAESRAKDLDSLLIHILLLSLLGVGSFVTWKGYITLSGDAFLGVSVQTILLWFDISIIVWIVFSLWLMQRRKRAMTDQLRAFGERGKQDSGSSIYQ